MKKVFIYLSVLFILCSCSAINGRVVAVDSYSSYGTGGGTYYLSTQTKGMELQQEYFENELQSMLLQKGYTRTFSKERADYNIVYNYGVKGPYTSLNSYPVPVNPWWNDNMFYGGVYNGYYGPTWTNSIETVDYYVKKLEVSAYNSNNKVVWQVLGTMKSEDMSMRGSMEYLVHGIKNYVGVNSNKVQYVNVYDNKNNPS